MARVFTREQFHELVWSKPMTHLAKEFGISDVALHKICRKHGIPNPPLGWWAKKTAGHSVKQTPLPREEAGSTDKIVIAGADLARETATLATVREEARILASNPGRDGAAGPHPIVERTLAKLRKSKPSNLGLVTIDGAGLIKCEIASKSIERLAVFLPRIVWAASQQGFELSAESAYAYFKSPSQTIGFSITEGVQRQKHVLTDAERAEEQAWERKRDLAIRRKSWDVLFDQPSFPDWDHHPSGRLSFEFEQVYVSYRASPRRSFRDAKIQRLENMVSEIAVALSVLAAAKTEQRLAREAEQQRAEEARRQRELAARIKHIEDRRVAGLDEILTELDELDKLRRLMAMLSAEGPSGPTPRLSAFLEWAKSHLAMREAQFTAQAIEDRFKAEHLFGDTDDHAFLPSRW